MSKSGDAPKVSGGIRQRLAKSESLEVAATTADSKPVSVPGPRKGIKQKLSESAPSRSESEVKVQKAQGTPLIDSLIHHWGKGKLTSQMALEFAFKAAQPPFHGHCSHSDHVLHCPRRASPSSFYDCVSRVDQARELAVRPAH